MPSINQGLAVFKPARGTYLPFSEGARACAGKKFATVEFVAVLVTLLRDHRLTLEEGWSAEGASRKEGRSIDTAAAGSDSTASC